MIDPDRIPEDVVEAAATEAAWEARDVELDTLTAEEWWPCLAPAIADRFRRIARAALAAGLEMVAGKVEAQKPTDCGLDDWQCGRGAGLHQAAKIIRFEED